MLAIYILVTGIGKRKLRFDAKKSFGSKKYGRISELTVPIPLQHASVNANDADLSVAL